jgi:hypothetical protein
MLDPISAGLRIFEQVLDQLDREERRKHEQKIKELEIIANSNLRDQFVAQLLLDQFLAPVEEAQITVQNTAKHAQYLAEIISYYYADHGMTQEQAKQICSQFRLVATKLTESTSLYDLKMIYRAITIFTDEIARFQHHNRHYSIQRSIRKGILNPLNTCIANYANFQRRTELFKGSVMLNALTGDNTSEQSLNLHRDSQLDNDRDQIVEFFDSAT